MALTSQHWSVATEPVMNRAFWFLGFSQSDRRESFLPTLFNMQGSQFATEEHQGIGGIPDDGWNFEDTGRVQYVEPIKGYKETLTHHEFASGIEVQRKMVDDGRVRQLMSDGEMLGDSAWRFREKAGANVFINAFSAATSETKDKYGTDATGPDGVALCSAAHPRHPGDTSTTDSNEGTETLNKSGLSTTRQAMMATVDLNGELLNVMPDELLVPPELEDTALELVRSMQDPESANNAINPQMGRFRVYVWHYLTDANAWFMMDSGLRRRHLVWYNRIPLEFEREQDFDTLVAKFRAYMRFSLGWSDWRWIYGQNPS